MPSAFAQDEITTPITEPAAPPVVEEAPAAEAPAAEAPAAEAPAAGVGQGPNLPGLPDLPKGPKLPNVPNGPNAPDLPNVPNTPNVPGLGGLDDLLGPGGGSQSQGGLLGGLGLRAGGQASDAATNDLLNYLFGS